MARTRLTVGLRDSLNRLADRTVDPLKEREALKAAYAKAAPLVRKAVEQTFPPKDMKVCQKYDAASGDDCIKLRMPGYVIDQFNFERGTGPLVAKKTYSGQIYDADEATASAVTAWLDAKAAYEAERKARLAAYASLISQATHLDAVTAVWPEAECLVPKVNLPAPLVEKQIDKIRADVAERQAAE